MHEKENNGAVRLMASSMVMCQQDVTEIQRQSSPKKECCNKARLQQRNKAKADNKQLYQFVFQKRRTKTNQDRCA